MDETQLETVLATLTPDEIEAAADGLYAYAAHRRSVANAPPGAAMGTFNLKGFFASFLKIIVAVLPVVAPLIGLDPKTLPPVTAPPPVGTTPPVSGAGVTMMDDL